MDLKLEELKNLSLDEIDEKFKEGGFLCNVFTKPFIILLAYIQEK